MSKVRRFTDSHGDKHHVLKYRGAEIRVCTTKMPISGIKRLCTLSLPDGSRPLVNTRNIDPYSLQGYDTVKSIIESCKLKIDLWHKYHDKQNG